MRSSATAWCAGTSSSRPAWRIRIGGGGEADGGGGEEADGGEADDGGEEGWEGEGWEGEEEARRCKASAASQWLRRNGARWR